MDRERDHTHEVERRVAAIPIRAADTCGFFEQRQSALLPRRECWYCIYASFPQDANMSRPEGFCRFKK